ncbi:DUF6907 domain-containing protein [Streptantibioticus ferralitis]|uniref:Uncharacterized protein n=1 Tax=Streptantibioticus ferralitis TaxID=236510 RepID=A0ABT5Z0K5_9ACTN|nr:hypothetical protein [Streptantibioticus ferralitis]MDF2257207.1 hypothetical protein [Streptantibioticus ferralitis]
MNAQDWKLSVTGDSCPEWCAQDHADDDPEHESIIHESTPLTVALPPMVNGERLQLSFTTICSEDYNHPEEGRSPSHIELGTESDQQGRMHDYIPFPSVEALDQLINDFRSTANMLEQWRERLPSAGQAA